MSIRDRLKAFLASKGISEGAFETKAGLAKGFVSKVGDSVRRSSLEKMCAVYPDLNTAWLLTGVGPMVGHERPPIEEVAPIVPEKVIYAPVVSQYAYGGYLSGFMQPEYLSQLPRMPFIVDQEADSDYVVFEVRGDSMDDGSSDSYQEGDRLLCREVDRTDWAQYRLPFNRWDYVIVHEEGILVKRITAHDVERHLITVHSLNPFYKDKVLDLAQVYKIFNVVDLIRRMRH